MPTGEAPFCQQQQQPLQQNVIGSVSLEGIQGLLLASENRLGQQIKHDMNGLEERLGGRIATVEVAQVEQPDQIKDILSRVQKLETGHRAHRSSSVPAGTRHDTEKEAFLGVLSYKTKKALINTAKLFTGDPGGFEQIDAPGNMGNHVFIKFHTAEQMKDFVAKNKDRAESAKLWLNHNRPRGTPEETTLAPHLAGQAELAARTAAR